MYYLLKGNGRGGQSLTRATVDGKLSCWESILLIALHGVVWELVAFFRPDG